MDFLSRRNGLFKNPNKKPLNELQIEIETVKKVRKIPLDKNLEEMRNALNKNYDVKIEKVPALDEFWIQKEHSYHDYQPFYSEVSKDENDLFISVNKLFLENIRFLLQCNYHQFWNYMIFEPRVDRILKGFLMNAVNWYEIKYLDGEFHELYNQIYESVAKIYIRLFTFKESDTEFMRDDAAIKLIEEHNLMNYPLIINICLLYGKTCQKLINDICDVFFAEKRKNSYKKELRKLFEHTLTVFEMIGGQICGFDDDRVIIPVGIRPKPDRFDPYWVEEVVTYLLDTAATLNSLLSNCCCAVEIAFLMEIPTRLAYFYNNVYSSLYEMLKDRSQLPFDWPKIKERILEHIGIGRSEFVNVFHVFVTYLIDNIIQSLGNNDKQDQYLEQYLKLISTALEDEFFIFDYQNTHQIDIQLQTIADFHPQIDHMRTDYILECLSTLPTLEKVLAMKAEIKKPTENILSLPTPSSSRTNKPQEHLYKEPNESEIYEMIKSVMDTLPHLGDGFIRECLKVYNNNASEVISAILDENLPPHLENLDKNMIYVPPEPEPEQPILAYKGKKPTYRDAIDLLDDKSEMQQVKAFVLKTSTAYDMYDDEYDDRDNEDPTLRFYDGNDEDNRHKPVENRFEGYELVSDPSESSSEEEQASARPRDAFCEDPAILRARREAHFNETKSKRGDVVGKPKGHGQDKNVVQSRDKKNVNKSSRANHNRKSGAQWKRNKGMVPM